MDWTDIVLALALVLVIEGLAYGLFPGPMRRLLALALELPLELLRQAGLVMALVGALLALALTWH